MTAAAISDVSLQLTLAIIKPHVLKVPGAIFKIRECMITNGFYRVRFKTVTIDREVLELFYQEHKSKFFYNRLIVSMKSGPSEICILARKNAILKWRELMGPTRVSKSRYTHPDTIRMQFGLTDTRNAVHGSDSVESANREISIMFPDFNITNWYKNEAKYYDLGHVIYDYEKSLHIIDNAALVSKYVKSISA